MHLLNVHTRKLERFGDSDVPMYAILSHTWGKSEISYQDIQNPAVDQRPEYEKVKKTCELTATHGLNYVWIDACCIDKTSSAELSEAINSMYNWYREAAICYAYLSDIELDYPHPLQQQNWSSGFRKSRWFSRGWTLQELIAPRIVVFLNRYWREIGTKVSLKNVLSAITRIPRDVLLGGGLQDSSVAQKMSWASRRETSRIEDRAYSLLGIFGVNMPLLYGEGERSFRRLQEQILSATDDYSIFAWQSSNAGASGLLARTPDVFYDSNDVFSDSSSPPPEEPIVINSKGIHVSVQLLRGSDSHAMDFAILPCKRPQFDGRLAIHLQSISGSKHHFERVNNQRLELIDEEEFRKVRPKRVCIKAGAEVQKESYRLSEAAAHGNELLVKYMLEAGVDPNDGRYNGLPSLTNAVLHRHENIVQRLMWHSIIASSPLLGTDTSLGLAVMTRQNAITSLLLQVVTLSTPLALSFTHELEVVTTMLTASFSHSAQELMIETNVSNTRDVLKVLLEHGGDLIAFHTFRPPDSPETSLHGMTPTSPKQGGADIENSNSWPTKSRRPEGLRVLNSSAGFACLICENGADLESKDSDGMTALAWAAAKGYTTILRGLCDSSADLESRDNLGATPLILAAKNDDRRTVKLLLDEGAKLPLHTAIKEDNTKLVQLLLEFGADPAGQKAHERYYLSPLTLAAWRGNEEIVKLLLDHGADSTITDPGGFTAISVTGNKAVMALLQADCAGGKREGKETNTKAPRRRTTAARSSLET